MKAKTNANHIADANKINVEIQLQEIVKSGNLEFKDVTFNPNGYPTNVGEYRALVGFNDQQDAKRFAELTDGLFTMFFKKDGWHLYVYKGTAGLTDIYALAGSCHVVFLDGKENYYNLCEKIFGISLIDFIKYAINDNEVPESWIKAAINNYINKSYQCPEGIIEDEEDYYDEIENIVIERLRYLDNFKGCKGYVVIDDVNWSVEGEYDSEYPAHYHEDNKHYIFGVMYPIEREEEIREII